MKTSTKILWLFSRAFQKYVWEKPYWTEKTIGQTWKRNTSKVPKANACNTSTKLRIFSGWKRCKYIPQQIVIWKIILRVNFLSFYWNNAVLFLWLQLTWADIALATFLDTFLPKYHIDGISRFSLLTELMHKVQACDKIKTYMDAQKATAF